MHVLRNLAFHRAMADSQKSWNQNQFWITAHNNYLDIAVLEWCKLFTDRSGMHHWRKSVTDQDEFRDMLLADVKSTPAEYETYALSFKEYRDKFVAHLDEENTIHVPRMAIARLSTQTLFRWLLTQENDCNAFHDAPHRPEDYYAVCLANARKTLRGEA
jgi:hypothetical protein